MHIPDYTDLEYHTGFCESKEHSFLNVLIFKLIFIGIQLLYNIVLFTTVQQRRSANIYKLGWQKRSFKFFCTMLGKNLNNLFGQSNVFPHVFSPPHFWISFPIRPTQSTEWSSPCYSVGSHQLSILYTAVCRQQSQSPSSSCISCPPWYPVCSVSLFLLCK